MDIDPMVGYIKIGLLHRLPEQACTGIYVIVFAK
jgi:hypothetical protein